MSSRQRAVAIYIGVLSLALIAVLVASLVRGADFEHNLGPWVLLIGLFALLELADLLFHHEGEREGLSSSEAVFIPLMVGFSFAQTVWGVVIAILAASIADRRVDSVRGTFNVANLGCSAAAAAGIWATLKDESVVFGVRDVGAAALAVLVFGILTHVFVTAVIALVQGKGPAMLSREMLPALGWNFAGNVSLGLFLAAAFLLSSWMVVLFPLPLAFLHFGYRAVVRQNAERKRVEQLLAASRALAASPSLEQALTDFLKAVRKVASAREARVVVDTRRDLVWSAVRGDDVTADMQTLEEGPMRDLLTEVERKQRALIVTARSPEDHPRLLKDLDASNVLAVPLFDGDAVVGCLVAIDRIGAEQFGHNEGRLLETLGHELVLTLDSYRLFAEVSEERERFRRIFTASKEGIMLLDDRVVVRAWNPALARISGYEAIEVVGHPWSERLVVRDHNARRVEGMALLEVSPDQELELVSRDGPSRWIAVLSSPVQGAQEKAWVVLVRDVTAEHVVEEAKSDFLSTISHELRTPLTAIKGSLAMLMKGAGKDNEETYDRLVGVMGKGTSRLERLVMNLLFVSQVDELGTPKVNIEDLDLVRTLKERTAIVLGDHPVRFDFDPDEEFSVRADRERVGQIVEHLVENAVKFDPDGEVVVELHQEAGLARLTVRDQGPGIPRADQERIFERFVRLGDVLTRQTQGPGVGLFIVKRSVEAMGGEVWVESKPGEGAAFHVTFPLARPMVVSGDAS